MWKFAIANLEVLAVLKILQGLGLDRNRDCSVIRQTHYHYVVSTAILLFIMAMA